MAYTIREKDINQINNANAQPISVLNNDKHSPRLTWADYNRIMQGSDPNNPRYVYDEKSGTKRFVRTDYSSPNMFVDPNTNQIKSAEFEQFLATHTEDIAKLNAVYTNQFSTLGSPDDHILNSWTALPFYITQGINVGIAEVGTGIIGAVAQLPGIVRETKAYNDFIQNSSKFSQSAREEAYDALVLRKQMQASNDGVMAEAPDFIDALLVNPDTLVGKDGKPISQEAKDYINSYKKLAKEHINVRENATIYNDMVAGMEDIENSNIYKMLGFNQTFRKEDTNKKLSILLGNAVGSAYGYGVAGSLVRSAMTGAATKAATYGASNLSSFLASTTTMSNVTKAAIFGTSFAQQAVDIRNMSLAKGYSVSEANALGIVAGTYEGAIEVALGFKYFNRFLTTDRSFINSLYYMVGEGSEEFFQTAGENALTQYTGLTEKQLSEIAGECILSFVGGALGAGLYSVGDMFGAQQYARNAARAYQAEETIRRARETGDTSSVALPMYEQPTIAGQETNNIPQDEVEQLEHKTQDTAIKEQLGVKTLKEIKAELINDAKRRAKQANNDITDKQLNEVGKTVQKMLDKEELDGEYANKFYHLSKRLIQSVEALNNQRAQFKQQLQGQNIEEADTETILNRLYDSDVNKDFRAQLDYIEADMANTLITRAGISQKAAKAYSKIFTNSIGNSLLLAKNSPMDIYMAIKPNIANVPFANYNGQLAITAIDSIKKIKNKDRIEDINSVMQVVKRIADASNGNKAAIAEMSKLLYGKNVDADYFKTLDYVLEQRASMFAQAFIGDNARGIEGLGFDIGNNMDRGDFKAMALLMAQGYSFTDYASLRGLEINKASSRNLDEEFSNKMKEIFPLLSEDEIQDIKYSIGEANIEGIDVGNIKQTIAEGNRQLSELGDTAPEPSNNTSQIETETTEEDIDLPNYSEVANTSFTPQSEIASARTEYASNKVKSLQARLSELNNKINNNEKLTQEERDEYKTLNNEINTYSAELKISEWENNLLNSKTGKSLKKINDARSVGKKMSDTANLSEDTKKAVNNKSNKVKKAKEQLFSKGNNIPSGNQIFSTYGMYDPDNNTMLIFDNSKTGVVGHEGIHFLLSGSIFNNIQALGENIALSVLPGMRPTNKLLTTIFDSLPKTVRKDANNPNSSKLTVDYVTAQETLVEAIFDYINNNTTGSKELDDLLKEEKDNINELVAHPDKSVYNKLSAKAKAALTENIRNLFAENASFEMFRLAGDVEEQLSTAPRGATAVSLFGLMNKYAIPEADTYLKALLAISNLTKSDFDDVAKTVLRKIKMQAANVALSNYKSDIDSNNNRVLDNANQRTLFAAATLADGELRDQSSIAEFLYSSQDAFQRVKQIWKDAGLSADSAGLKKVYNKVAKTVDDLTASGYIISLADLAGRVSPNLRAELEQKQYAFSNTVKKLSKPAVECSKILSRINFDERRKFVLVLNNIVLNNELGPKKRLSNAIDRYMPGYGYSESDINKFKKNMLDMYDNLEKLHSDLASVGVNIGKLKDYWPRILINSNESLNKIRDYYGWAHSNNITSMIYEASRKGFTTDGNIEAMFDAANGFLRSARSYDNNTDNATLSHERVLENVPAELSDCFLDPFSAYTRYVEFAERTIMMRRLFGAQVAEDPKSLPSVVSQAAEKIIDANGNINNDEIEALSGIDGVGTIGKLLLMQEGEMIKRDREAKTDEQKSEYNELRDAYNHSLKKFEEGLEGFLTRTKGGKSKVIQGTRAAISVMALANPVAGLSNLKENVIVGLFYGIANTIKTNYQVWIKGEKMMFDIEDFAISDLNEILSTGLSTGMKDVQEWALKWGSFTYFDHKQKTVTLNVIGTAARECFAKGKDGSYDISAENDRKYKMRQRYLRKNIREAFSYLGEDRLSGALDSLNTGIISGQQGEDAKYMLTTLLERIQPINSLSTASKYNSMDDVGKMCFYSLRTVGLKQLAALSDYGRFCIANGDWKKWLTEIVRLAVSCVVFGTTTDVVKDLARLRVPNVTNSALFSIPDLFMINRYTISIAEKEGLGAAIAKSFTPPINVFNFSNGKFFLRIPILGFFPYAIYSMVADDGNTRNKHTRKLLTEDEETFAHNNSI